MKNFELKVFQNLSQQPAKKSLSRTAALSTPSATDSPPQSLDLRAVKAAYPFARIKDTGDKITVSFPRVAFSSSKVSTDLRKLLKGSNPEIDLEFSEDLLDYEADQSLIKKSAVPLWLIKKVAGSTLMIQRIC